MSEQKSGFVFLHKPPGITSFKALEALKSKNKKYKVGHTGTLDKFAEGLLIAVIGRMTKFSTYISSLDKEYFAEIRFGTATDTLDPEGKVTATSGYIPTVEEVKEALKRYTGRIEQTPPFYSAVHINGKRAYQLARNGITPELKARTVHIHSIKPESYEYPLLCIRVDCSKGTYIRSLARDIACSCRTVAYVKRLMRSKIGPFYLDEAVSTHEFSLERDIISPKEIFRRLDFVRETTVKNGYAKNLQEGKKISPYFFQTETFARGLYAVFNTEERFIALIERDANGFSYKFTGNG